MGVSADKAILDRCLAAIKSVDPDAEIVLFGSRARGDAEPDSDYDLLVLTGGDVGLQHEESILRALFPIEMETGAVLTFLLHKHTWNSPIYRAMPIRQNIDREGIVL